MGIGVTEIKTLQVGAGLIHDTVPRKVGFTTTSMCDG